MQVPGSTTRPPSSTRYLTASSIEDLESGTFTKDDAVDLEGLYEETLTYNDRSNRQGVFHPSAVGMCGRRNVYEFIRTPFIAAVDPDDQEIFDTGHAFHDIIQKRMENLTAVERRGFCYTFQKEVGYDPATDKLYNEFGIGGTADGVLHFYEGYEGANESWSQKAILEAKSIKADRFDDLRGPKEDHLMQAHIYAYRFDCPIIYIWYRNKDTSKRKVYTRLFDHDLFQKALDRYIGWLGHAAAGTLPDREENWYMCPRCEYRDTCNPPILGKIRSKAAAKSVSNIRKNGLIQGKK